jgi:hypothetical protein
MSKKIQLAGYSKEGDGQIVLYTTDFSVKVKFQDGTFYEAAKRTSQGIDSFVRFEYTVLTKTTYATNLRIKKFLRKFFIGAVKDYLYDF